MAEPISPRQRSPIARRLMRRASFLSVVALLVALFSAGGACAQSTESFSGKTIRLYIGTGPGGGYDTYGRLVARHIGRQLPGNPAVVPQNMPGAASLTLTNFLYNQAPRDGTALAIINQAMPTEQYLLEQNINYDAAKFNWIGRVSSSVKCIPPRDSSQRHCGVCATSIMHGTSKMFLS